MKASRVSKTIRPEHIRRETTMSSMMNAMETGKEINDLHDKEAEDEAENKERKRPPCGVTPSQKEIDDHELTHIPFRSWCKHCVFGRAQSHPHYKDKETEKPGHPTVSWDYC